MQGKPRPFKVRWFSPHWMEYIGQSYAYEDRAMAVARQMHAEGCYEVLVWENNPDGTHKRTIWRGTEKDFLSGLANR